MSPLRAVVRIDRHKAELLQLDTEHVHAERFKSHEHYTGQHGSAVWTEYEFFGAVCDAVAGIAYIFVVGSHTA